MSAVATIILALYQLFGISHGWGSQTLQQQLLHTHKQPSLLITTEVARPALPTKLGSETLSLSATSVIVLDEATMAPLYSKDPDKSLPIASLTKMTTALVSLQDHTAEQIITIPALPSYGPDDVVLPATPGEQFSFRQLLAAALIPSANDAADSLAISDSGTIPAFSAKMNRLVTSWGIRGVHYSNPSGLTDQDNYATARSLAQIAKLGLQNSLFAQITSTPSATITDQAGKSFKLVSTNHLFDDPRIKGVKTGFTASAGQCFVGLAAINGHDVITVVLGSNDRFGETKQLLDWTERNYTWQ